MRSRRLQGGRARRGLAALALVLAALPPRAAAQGRLPMRAFGVADGVPGADVRRIVCDSHGFVWFCTVGGLGRFDGEGFRNYGPADGLAGVLVTDVVEERDRSTYWVGTDEGLFRFDAERASSRGALFERRELPVGGTVRRLLLDREERLWVATTQGLAVVEPGRRSARKVLPEPSERHDAVFALLEDGAGVIWAGTHERGLFRIADGGSSVQRLPETIRGLSFIRDLALDVDGNVWCTFLGGVARLRGDAAHDADPVAEIFDAERGLASNDTGVLLVHSPTEILVTTTAGITRLARASDGSWSLAGNWTMRDGLTSAGVSALTLDATGGLWIGTLVRGAMQLLRGGFRRHPEIEESGSSVIGLIGDEPRGVLALAAVGASAYRLHRLGDAHHTVVDVALPSDVSYLGWGVERLARDRAGRFWLATGQGLLRYDDARGVGAERLAAPPDRRFGIEDGLPGTDVLWVTVDSSDSVWVGLSDPNATNVLARSPPGSERFRAEPSGRRLERDELAWSFAEDRRGSAWIAFTSGRILRFDPDGREAETVVFDPPLPRIESKLWFDSRGRLWIAPERKQAMYVVDDPSAARLSARPAPAVVDDLPVATFAEDVLGRLYFGGRKGLVRFDESTGLLRRFTRAEGLPGDSVIRSRRDSSGDLWFGDAHGLSVLSPEPDPPRATPTVRFARLALDGEALAIAPLGAAALGPIEAGAGAHHVALEFFALGQAPGERVLFQHRFEDDPRWSAPSAARTLEFPRLGAGRHRLLVRACVPPGSGASDAAPPPAALELVFPAPLWRRPWFLALAALAAGALGYAVLRARVARLLALERMRTRIASDLHDEVGADLSRISLLADFARRDLGEAPERARAILGDVAKSARDTVAGMSDIVWALKPERDTLGQVLTRVHDFAAAACVPAGIALAVRCEPELERLPLAGERRRELFLLLKEAVTNAVRHARARRVELEVRRDGRELVVELRDDGDGFDAAAPGRSGGGHGLEHMRARGARLGGTAEVTSAPGRGTRVRVTFRARGHEHAPDGRRGGG